MAHLSFNNFVALGFLGALVVLTEATFSKNIPGHTTVGDLLIGQACTTYQDCPSGAECYPGQYCYCEKNYIQSASLTRCLPIVKSFGDECEESQQCQVNRNFHLNRCNEGRCDCTADSIYGDSYLNWFCRKKAVNVMDSCMDQAECVANLDSAFCLNEQCHCMEGYVASENGTRCILEISI